MKTRAIFQFERGAVLVISMLFLLVVTIISVVAARNSTLSTKMASNMQDSYASFQSAEAGILATLLLGRTADNPFESVDVDDVFGPLADEDNPLAGLSNPDDVEVLVNYNEDTTQCPRQPARRATSNGIFDCEYYRVESEHQVPQRARTRVDLGVVRTLMQDSSP